MRFARNIPAAFWWRRLHSFAGFGLTVYLFFHLLTNAQAGLWMSVEGKEFIREVNAIHEIPVLRFIELSVLALPILIHSLFGIYYLRTGEYNSFPSDGTHPYLTYGRNRAYSWQRITSWILLVGLFAHIAHMRFIEYPSMAQEGSKQYFALSFTDQPALHALAKKIDVRLFNAEGIREMAGGDEQTKLLKSFTLKPQEVVAVANHFGPLTLLLVRETFKSPLMVLLYTIFVLAACFHAFNGLWTFLISWGVTLSQRSQTIALYFSTVLMAIATFMGLVAIYGSYWINLRQ